ncbi:MAG: hypothetical protein AAFP02_20285 [Bacteroidota bacterium]
MSLRIYLIGLLLGACTMLTTPAFAGSYASEAPQDAKAKLERLMLRQKHGQKLGTMAGKQIKKRWQGFQQKQKARPFLDRWLRYTILCILAAIVFGALAGTVANLSAALGSVFSVIGSAAALGALVFFILWILDKV